ncbi:hypothetical protein [Aeromonas veronii]|uniref:hypothetical protein n=1 Tax=Aeromonas veronii TaxID=654 RepID=UPI003F79E990
MEDGCLLNEWLRIGAYTDGEKGVNGVLHCVNEEGVDWYEQVLTLPTAGVYVLVGDGVVVCRSLDPSRIFPGGFELFWSETQTAELGSLFHYK